MVPELFAQKLREKIDVAHKFENAEQLADKKPSGGKSKSRKKKA